MAILLWTLRCLVSLFLGLVVLAALSGWLVSSILVSDLNSEDSQLVRLTRIAETVDHPEAAEFRRLVLAFRDGTNQDLAQVRNFLPALIIVGLAAMGLIHLPDTTASLRWPGYTLLVSGVIALALVWLAHVTLAGAVGRMAGPQLFVEAQGATKVLLLGSVAPGLGATLIGATVVTASCALEQLRRPKSNSNPLKAGCR